jgi:hypothetical protein
MNVNSKNNFFEITFSPSIAPPPASDMSVEFFFFIFILLLFILICMRSSRTCRLRPTNDSEFRSIRRCGGFDHSLEVQKTRSLLRGSRTGR